jgi:hypothetical protein
MVLDRANETLTVQLLHTEGCPYVEAARTALHAALVRRGLTVDVDERVGAFASPTVLVDGVDVLGRAATEAASCRLDRPTERQILEALDVALQRRARDEANGGNQQ